jgi:hypothetical protein
MKAREVDAQKIKLLQSNLEMLADIVLTGTIDDAQMVAKSLLASVRPPPPPPPSQRSPPSDKDTLRSNAASGVPRASSNVSLRIVTFLAFVTLCCTDCKKSKTVNSLHSRAVRYFAREKGS